MRQNRKIISFDTEDKDGELKLAVFYDGKDSVVCYDKFECREFISQQRKVDFWAHNLEYDLINIYCDAFDRLSEMVYSGSHMVYAKFNTNSFYDTFNHYKTSLKRIGDQIGLKKMETSDDTGGFFNVDYCQRDAQIVYEFVKLLQKTYGIYDTKIYATIASQAIHIYLKNYYAGKIYVPEKEVIAELKQAYYGGRVEIFKMGEIRSDSIVKYDVNSLYPSIMSRKKFPIPEIPKKVDYIPEYGIAKVTISAPYTEFPILPLRQDGKLFFPYGKWSASYPVNLLNYAIKNGYQIEKVHYAYEYSAATNPFKPYVSEMYPKRKQSSMDSIIYKLLLNSLYGKFAQSNIKTSVKIYRNEFNQQYLDISQEEGDYPKWSNFIWSIYVTGYALEEIHKLIIRGDEIGDVLYCDTDCVIVNSNITLATSDELGDIKIEETGKIFEAKSPKVYRLDNQYKAKGVPKASQENYFKLGTAEFVRPIRLKESFRRDLTPNVWITHTKKLVSAYDKRKVLPDGRTFPHKACNKGIILNGES